MCSGVLENNKTASRAKKTTERGKIMFFKSIELINFRNYDRLLLKFDQHINIIVGKNGQGKTNILESLYYFAYLKSHRVNDDNILIKSSKNAFKIKCKLKRDVLIDELRIEYNKFNKKILLNQQEISKKSEYLQILNLILFEPSNLEMLKGAPNIRRDYLNDAISKINGNYYNILNDYNKLLKMRNEFLKSKRNDLDYLETLDKYFVEKAAVIYQMRAKYISKINEFISKIYYDIMNLNGLKIKYKSFYETIADKNEIKKQLIDEMKKNYQKEKYTGHTIEGPHKDDFIFEIDFQNLKEYGSQGQQRAAVISFKFAEAEIIKKYKNTNPIFLLDDVFSELDGIRKNNLLKYIANEYQVILTTTDVTKISKKLLDKANIIKIDTGQVI